MTLTAIESMRGAKNQHPMTRCLCDCGRERMVRTTRFKLGSVTLCAYCAKAAAAIKGANTRRLPADIALTREIMGIYVGGARRRNLVFALTEQEVARLIRSNCNYCGGKPDPTNGIDRVDNLQAYTNSNSVPCCAFCNYSKRDMPVQSFLDWAKRIHEYQSSLAECQP